MPPYFNVDDFKIIENGFDPLKGRFTESIMSLGNGHMGLRGNFEEAYSGDTLQGTYIAGVYYPDKTKVGWWKIGYPSHFAKVINACRFIGIRIFIGGSECDLAKSRFKDFVRVLDLKRGYLQRSFVWIDDANHETRIEAERFLSMAAPEIGAVRLCVTPLNHREPITLMSTLEGDIRNADSNYDELFWDCVDLQAADAFGSIALQTKKTRFLVATAMMHQLNSSALNQPVQSLTTQKGSSCSITYTINTEMGQPYTLEKFFAVTTNRDYTEALVSLNAAQKVKRAAQAGWNALYAEHTRAWSDIWDRSDVVIEGDPLSQQGIRYNIFQINQTYTGKDPRLNIGPKGFTGEKYGGGTYWDTEAFCLPFFLGTAEASASRNLLLYRFYHLKSAKENAASLGLKGALYPMVTMNGEESHNEWEITFEEIHRNAAITYAIYNYVNYTGDAQYLMDYGVDVLVETARFWADRVDYHPQKHCYMLLGVTGPNEYENNVNNNWYTNTMAAWSLRYTNEILTWIETSDLESFQQVKRRLSLNDQEICTFAEISSKMYFPFLEEYNVVSQQDGYGDKLQQTTQDIKADERPICRHWSWDRILRSCFIKQADVIQGIYHFPNLLDLDAQKRHFDFYEARTVHESSLSALIHSIVASRIGYTERAYELFLRASRIDLDNYNGDTEDGLHITSTTGAWLAIVQGFAGMRVSSGGLVFSPSLPAAWHSYAFKLLFRENTLRISVNRDYVEISLEEGGGAHVTLYSETGYLMSGQSLCVRRCAAQ